MYSAPSSVVEEAFILAARGDDGSCRAFVNSIDSAGTAVAMFAEALRIE
jgi:hypothetical protein